MVLKKKMFHFKFYRTYTQTYTHTTTTHTSFINNAKNILKNEFVDNSVMVLGVLGLYEFGWFGDMSYAYDA